MTVINKIISLEPNTDAISINFKKTAFVCWSAQYATFSSNKNPCVPVVNNATTINRNKKTPATIKGILLFVFIVFHHTLSSNLSTFYKNNTIYTIVLANLK